MPDRVFYGVSYTVFALPLILFYVFFIPPFQVPDESSHFARAYQVAKGEFFPTRQAVPTKPDEYFLGGTVDPGIFNAARYYAYLSFHSDRKVVADKVASGYWNIMDPTNGFTAIERTALKQLELDKIHPRYFFESDMLCRLATIRAVVRDVPLATIDD